MSQNGYAAYGKNQRSSANPRDVEYELLARANASLQKALEASGPLAIKVKAEAALKNREIWSVFRADLSSEGNQLPKKLRADLVSLSLWVEREVQNVLNGEGDIETMIFINQQIMAGLKGDPGPGLGEETPQTPLEAEPQESSNA